MYQHNLIQSCTCRKAETEADSIGMRLAAKACYDPAAAGEALSPACPHLGALLTQCQTEGNLAPFLAHGFCVHMTADAYLPLNPLSSSQWGVWSPLPPPPPPPPHPHSPPTPPFLTRGRGVGPRPPPPPPLSAPVVPPRLAATFPPRLHLHANTVCCTVITLWSMLLL